MSGDVVTLTPSELRIAAMIGVEWRIAALTHGRQPRYGQLVDHIWQHNIDGACGEAVFAKWRNCYWLGNGEVAGTRDVGDVQIRTAQGDNARLILHPSDSDVDVFILVTGRAPTFCLRGWCYGREGKRQEYWKDPGTGRPAYFVPHAALRPMRGNT